MSETSVVVATLMAIDEINQEGGRKHDHQGHCNSVKRGNCGRGVYFLRQQCCGRGSSQDPGRFICNLGRKLGIYGRETIK